MQLFNDNYYPINVITFFSCSMHLRIRRRDGLTSEVGYGLYDCSAMADPGIDGRIILRWIFRKWDVGAWTESSWLRRGAGGGHLSMW